MKKLYFDNIIHNRPPSKEDHQFGDGVLWTMRKPYWRDINHPEGDYEIRYWVCRRSNDFWYWKELQEVPGGVSILYANLCHECKTISDRIFDNIMPSLWEFIDFNKIKCEKHKEKL